MCTPLWREAHFQVKMYKTHQRSDHFWKLRCRKSVRRRGAKHIFKSKCTKHTMGLGPLLEVQMSKKCTPLWREAGFEGKIVQNTLFSDHFWKFRSRKRAGRFGAKHIWKSKCYKTLGVRGSDDFWKFRSRKSARRCGAKHSFKSKCYTNTRGSDHFWKFRSRQSTRFTGVPATFRSPLHC